MSQDDNIADRFNEGQKGALPGVLNIRWSEVRKGLARGAFTVEAQHMAPNGFLHAASVIALLDTGCGYGCIASLPDGAQNFTTIELKSNFLGTAREGTVDCEARLVHGGRTTQVWDAAAVHRETGKTIALFRCTQMVLYPKA
jgi:1,4-dihydroxy-2-naphthoyl-CoA hydrolase